MHGPYVQDAAWGSERALLLVRILALNWRHHEFTIESIHLSVQGGAEEGESILRDFFNALLEYSGVNASIEAAMEMEAPHLAPLSQLSISELGLRLSGWGAPVLCHKEEPRRQARDMIEHSRRSRGRMVCILAQLLLGIQCPFKYFADCTIQTV
jgi:hypothetical protein